MSITEAYERISKSKINFSDNRQDFNIQSCVRDYDTNNFTGLFDHNETMLFSNIYPYVEGRALLADELYNLLKMIGEDTQHGQTPEGTSSSVEANGLTTDMALLQKFLIFTNALIIPSVISKKDKFMAKIMEEIFDQDLSNQFKNGCFRCGSKDLLETDCPRCKRRCFVCRECLKMGEARSCTPLFLFSKEQNLQLKIKISPEASFGQNKLESMPKGKLDYDYKSDDLLENLPHLDFDLTPAQKEAYDMASEFLDREEKKALIFALCGGGKTEAVYGAVKKIIKKGGKVLFATPRRDLTRELSHRLEKAFPGIRINTFYGGFKNKLSDGEFVVSTTHQLYRFYRAFDLVILDEADAFPYRGSNNLPLLLGRSLKKDAKLIYISATPEKSLLKETKKKTAYLITIPARFHKKPAPLPKLIKVSKKGMEGNNGKFSKKITSFIDKNLDLNKPMLVFVPTINLAEETSRRLEKYLRKQNYLKKQEHLSNDADNSIASIVSFSHSKDPKRDEKLIEFTNGKIKILVSTTILERGITLEGVRVLVLFSNHDVFDDRALVQMAGRSGRTGADPYGEVIFAGEYITKAMKRARKLIDRLNKEALKKGFIEE
ncbi:DEAD/DEAH box helicase family protein [Natranaerofaba carboxydovora]|uniref:DEAD/DEAH box helicase family protein n=1 Tax=Natranaerofaba carboxydovora TaxID=2742683 RepID=UPI001F146979|nr:DEAD/DEAH box helicase family protein [Natranaerofaba carboxydovora]UMZ75003.1 ComF operon protein 1 [Natranaerofaba carboxydovora]